MPQVGTLEFNTHPEVREDAHDTSLGNGSARQPCVLDSRCGSRKVLERIADRWTALVIYALSRGTRRYGELKREIGGVSQKMLTQTLRGLERDGLVHREVYATVPPRVEYSLTPLGRTLIEPLKAICKWAEEHLHEMESARARGQDRSTTG